jgi:hypothetical protein
MNGASIRCLAAYSYGLQPTSKGHSAAYQLARSRSAFWLAVEQANLFCHQPQGTLNPTELYADKCRLALGFSYVRRAAPSWGGFVVIFLAFERSPSMINTLG